MLNFTAKAATAVHLDYAGADALDELMRNLSSVAAADGRLWTLSDEGRTIERLVPDGDGFKLEAQLELDALFPELPTGHEADLEGLDVSEGRLWLSGSHCRVRRSAGKDGALSPKLRARPSRHLLGAVPAVDGKGKRFALPFAGKGSLRRRLAGDAFIGPFVAIPSKENGLDVEGLAVGDDAIYLGLRGPVIDSFAVVVELPLLADGTVSGKRHRRHFLDLGGLGVRDLCRDDAGFLVLAGPVTGSDGPFRLFRWRPARSDAPQAPERVGAWAAGLGNPEGICRFSRDGRAGLLVVYDSPPASRIDGTRYRADWFALDV